MTHALYGQLPPGLLDIAANAMQCSPLIPGSKALETLHDGALTSMVILAPPSTIERRYVLARALQACAPDAPLTLLALKDKGGNRIKAELEAFGCSVEESPRSHYRICTTTRPTRLTNTDDALSNGAQQLVDGLWSQPGVFSWNRIDAGSALLLKHLPALSGAGADLGCGIGVLSRQVLASPSVTALSLIDIDQRAIEAAKRNVIDPRARLIWADVRDPLAQLNGLDFVIMNPPFHDGGMEDKSLGQAFISRAAQLLKPGGSCWLTANRHLPYEALLEKLFSRNTLVAEANGFKIYASVK